jgi:microcystin-dependent protein
MSSYALAPSPRLTFLSLAGVPLAGGRVDTFLSGVSTAAVTYSDIAGTSQGTSVTLDAAGRCTIFLLRGTAYQFAVYDVAGSLQYIQPGIEVYDDPTAPVVPLDVPIGTMMAYCGTSAPTGYLLCIGTSCLRATYPLLFGVMGTLWGSVDSTHFTLPDMRGSFPFGKATSGTGSTLGGSFGTIDHVHTGPEHEHVLGGTTESDGTAAVTGSTASGTADLATTVDGGTGSEYNVVVTVTDNGHSHGAGTLAGPAHTHDLDSSISGLATIAKAGTGNTGTANPPGVAFNWIVKCDE